MKLEWFKPRMVLATLVACALIGLVLTVNLGRARAQLDESMVRSFTPLVDASTLLLRLGSFPAPDERGNAAPVTVTLNGATARISVRSFSGDPAAGIEKLFAEFERDCATSLTSSLPESIVLVPSVPPLSARTESGGVNHCLKLRAPLTLEGLRDWARDSGTAPLDLNGLGIFQSLVMRAGDDSVTVLSLEIVHGLSPSLMFPLGGDAPGRDFSDFPRPAGRRVLSVSVSARSAADSAPPPAFPREDASPAINSYASTSPLAEALGEFRQQLGDKSLRVIRQLGRSAFLLLTPHGSFIVAGSSTQNGSLLTIARIPS